MLNNTITTIGSALYDVMFYTDEAVLSYNATDLLRQRLISFEYGAKLYAKDAHFVGGGSGANVAVTFANLGIKTQLISAVGNDFLGHNVIQSLKNKRINTKLIQVKARSLTGLSFVVNVGKELDHVIFTVRGASDNLDLNETVIRKINTPWIYLAALGGNFKPKLENIFQLVSKKHKKIVWNPGASQIALGAKFLAKYLDRTYLLVVNRDEALEILSSQRLKLNNNVNVLIKHLHKYGQKYTAITVGEKGAYLYDGQKIYFQKALKKKTVNTTGAGDAFASGLTAGLIKYGSSHLDKSLRLAITNSAAVVTEIGGQVGLLKSSDLIKYKL